jgi:hypothetical protein
MMKESVEVFSSKECDAIRSAIDHVLKDEAMLKDKVTPEMQQTQVILLLLCHRNHMVECIRVNTCNRYS